MTREEAISIMNVIIHMLEPQYDNDRVEEAVDMAIKALEQEPILDKIRAEIKRVMSIMDDEIKNHDRKDLINFVNGLNQSLTIIDKYKAESEDKK